MDSHFTIALAQIDPSLGDVTGNLARHCDAIARAREGGADLVVFPELSLSGYSVKDLNWDTAIRPGKSPPLETLLEQSRDISIIFGSVEEGDDFGIYNSAFLLEQGAIRHVHRKIHPPTYGMFEESRYFSAGKTVRAADTRFGKTGILICEDFWHLSLPYLLNQQGCWLLVFLSASPTRLSPGEKEITIARVNEEHCKVYARLLSSYVLYCNRVGFEDGVGFWGGSLVADPHGDIVVQAKYFEEDLVFLKVAREEVARARRFSRHTLDENPALVLQELRRINRERS